MFLNCMIGGRILTELAQNYFFKERSDKCQMYII